MDIYSSGLTLLTLGVRIPRWTAAAIDGVLMIAGAIYVVFYSSSSFIYLFEAYLIFLGVPMAAWCGVFLADLLLRRRDYHEPSLYTSSGIYGRVRLSAVLFLALGTAVGWGLVIVTTGQSKGLTWLGYLMDGVTVNGHTYVDLGGTGGPWAYANLGVPVALAVGFVGYLVFGFVGVRRRSATDSGPVSGTWSRSGTIGSVVHRTGRHPVSEPPRRARRRWWCRHRGRCGRRCRRAEASSRTRIESTMGGVAERPPGGAGTAVEQRVAGEDAAQVGREQADRAGRVAGCVQHGQRRPGHRDARAVGQVDVPQEVGVRELPQRPLVGVQQDRRGHGLAQGRRDAHVVVVAVGAHDRGHAATADHVEDRLDGVRGVDHHARLVVTDHPDVVVDVEGLPSRLNVPLVTPWSTRRRSREDHHAAQHVAVVHLLERRLHVAEPDLLGDERVEVEPSLLVEVETSIGKSREGRQSPYQLDFSAPPRPKTSISGMSGTLMSGVGTPTRTTVPARSRA